MKIFRLSSLIIRRRRQSSLVSAVGVVIAALALFASAPASAEVTSTSGRAGEYTVYTPALLTAGETLVAYPREPHDGGAPFIVYDYRGTFTTGGLVV